MKKRLIDITNHRTELLEKIKAQRTELAAISNQLKKPLEVVDIGLKAVRFVRAHPGWVMGGLTALMVWRRNGLIRFVKGYWRYYPSVLSYGLKLLPLGKQSTSKAPKYRIND